MASICTALNLSDDKPCQEPTNANGVFCPFHARQVQNLYKGYKKRSADLAALESSLPSYLASLETPLRNETFGALDDEPTLNEVYKHLFQRYNLIDRVIRGRKLHHAHFYSQTMDWGHKQYIDRLVNDKSTVSRALERVTRRIAEVLYRRKKWFKWVRERQDDEEASREKEVEKIKKEAKLFKRHMNQVEARLRKKKQHEDQRRQDAYLEQAYEERFRQANASNVEQDQEYEGKWDPIEDSIESEREDFIAVVKRLLWICEDTMEATGLEPEGAQAGAEDRSTASKTVTTATGKQNTDPNGAPLGKGEAAGVAVSRNAKKRAKTKAKAATKDDQPTARHINGQGSDVPKIEVNETRREMRQRLLAGHEYQPNPGLNVAGNTIDTGSADAYGKIPGMPEEEADKILDEVAEIKELLFCRILLSHSTTLPAALQAQSVAAFLADPEVGSTDLRDVCLQVGQPSLQALRDACADFARGDQEESEEEDEVEEDEQTAHHKAIMKEQHRRRLFREDAPQPSRGDEVPETWRTEHELSLERRAQSCIATEEGKGTATVIDFGAIDDQGDFRSRKMRVGVCGKSIWNYPSEKVMARGGWLHYSIIAKGSRFEDAVALCRNWEEFWDQHPRDIQLLSYEQLVVLERGSPKEAAIATWADPISDF